MAFKNLFSTKHQRLVNQCYPTGKTTEKRAKSSETSYLIYYVNSRRTKLEKVSVYLLKRSSKDISSKKIGNVIVTLELMAKIVSSCKENLNVFLSNFLSILISIENNRAINGDAAVIEGLVTVLENICSAIDVNLVTPSQLAAFETFIELFFTKICGDTESKQLQPEHYNEYILKGCIAITYIKGIKFVASLREQLLKGAYTSLKLFQEIHPQYQNVNLRAWNSNDDTLTKRLTLTRSITNKQIGLDDYTDNNTTDLSIISLKKYFNTLEADMLPISIRALIRVLTETPNKDLFKFVVHGIPVQTRYISILIIVNHLTTNASPENSIIFMKLISSLIRTEVSIVGLSVVDIIKKLLNFQTSNVNNRAIVEQGTITVADLNTRTFYKDQTLDIIQEISSRIQNLSRKSEQDEETFSIKEVLMKDLNYLISLTKTDECISLDLFNELLTFAYPGIIISTHFFKLIQKNTVTFISMKNLLQKLKNIDDNMAVNIISNNFKLFGSVTLLSGLAFYQQPENCHSSTQYHWYHLEASRFLGLADYEQQSVGNKEKSRVFSNSTLLNFYSDQGANTYAQKGQTILKSLSANSSLSLDPRNNDKHALQLNSTAEKQNDLAIANDMLKMDLNTLSVKSIPTPTMDHKPPRVSNFDSKSLHSLSYNKPSVSQLRGYVKSSKNESQMPRQASTTHASQSVKSRVTNITFLLSELNDQASDIPIPDPDEEDIVGLENYGKSSAQTKLQRFSIKRLSNLSALNTIHSNTPSQNGHLSIQPNLESIDQDVSETFVDAEDEVSFNDNNRGKLFV